jgi:predicted ATP-grasp superfamily ATP-dependent carboligase
MPSGLILNTSQRNSMAGKGRRTHRVLVLDGEWESALAITRSLGRQGLAIDLGSSVPRPIAGFSRYCREGFTYPNPMQDIEGFHESILRRVKSNPYALLLPVTDATICPLIKIRKAIEDCCPIGMASNEALEAAHSKSSIYELARQLTIPFPKSVRVGNLDEYHQVRRQVQFPLVVKPDRSKVWSQQGTGLNLSTVYAFNTQELDLFAKTLLEDGSFVLQEYIHGEVVGVGALASKGKILFAFQFRSLHEVPLTGGISSYRISEKLDTGLLEQTSRLLEALAWDGIAHVEFILQRTSGKPFLMEINGRFWASLPLAITSGADFPYFLYQLLVNGNKDFSPFYRVGLSGHQLFQERKWLKQVMLDRRGDHGEIIHYPGYGAIFKDLVSILQHDHHIDTFDKADLLPFLYDGFRIVDDTLEELKRKLRG